MSNSKKGNEEKSSTESEIYTTVSAAIVILTLALIIYSAVSTIRYSVSPAPVTTVWDAGTPVSASSDGQTLSQTQSAAAETSAQTAPPESSAQTSSGDTTADIYLAQDSGYVAQTFETSDYEALYPGTTLTATADMGREYLDKIIFLGDSTTYGLARYKMLRDGRKTKQVWTPLSGTLTLNMATAVKIYYPDDDCELTIADAVSRRKPDIMVVTLGVNGVSFMDEKYFTSEYEKVIGLIKTNSPDTHIICQSIFPVAASYGVLSQINNQKISAANSWIAAAAKECGVYFLDTYSALVGANGWLPEDYQNGDGMHLNEKSFTVELDYIRTHAIPEYVKSHS